MLHVFPFKKTVWNFGPAFRQAGHYPFYFDTSFQQHTAINENKTQDPRQMFLICFSQWLTSGEHATGSIRFHVQARTNHEALSEHEVAGGRHIQI